MYWIWSSCTTFTAYCFPGMSLQRVFVLLVFVCSVNLSLFSGYYAEGYHAPPISYGYHAEGYHARTDTFKLTGYHVCRVTASELPRSIQTYVYRRVSHLRVVFGCFSYHRLICRCFHKNNHNLPTEPGAHRTDAHNTLFPTEPGAHRTDPLNSLVSSNNSEASVWMVARPCVRPDLLHREWTWAAAGGRTGRPAG